MVNSRVYSYFKFGLTVMSASLILCFSGLQAQVAYNNNTNVTTSPQYSQSWLGSMGMLFSVNQKATVLSLGAFSNGSNVFAQDITVQLWDTANTLNPIASSVLSSSFVPIYAQIDQSLFTGISPVSLSPGNIYAIVAYGFGAAQPNGNGFGGPVPWTVSSLLTPIGLGIYDVQGNNGLFPSIADTGPANRYQAGTFQFVVPEPGTYALLGSFIALSLFLRSRRAEKQLV